MVKINRILTAQKLFVIFFVTCLSISYFSVIPSTFSSSDAKVTTNLQTSSSLDSQYTAINPDGVQPVGNFTIEKIEFLEPGTMETTTVGVNPQTISFTYLDYDWVSVQKIAYEESYGTEWWESGVEIRLNESVRYDYHANDTATLLSYKPELDRGEIISMSINSTPVNVDDVKLSSFGGFIYNYSDIHSAYPSGRLFVDYVYDYNITITNWRLRQKIFPDAPVESPYIDLYQPKTITSYYNYTYQVGKFNVNMTVDFIVNLPDVNYIKNMVWKKRFNLTSTLPFEDYTQLSNKSFRLNNIPIDTKVYLIDFTVNHTIDFVNKFSDYWRRDYLVDQTDIRTRDFDISVINGPPRILVSNFRLNLTEFVYEEHFEVSSILGRSLETFNLRDIGDRSQNGTRIDFLGGKGYLAADYYLALGEIDSISIKYRAPSSLNIKIVDRINTPLKNAEVKLNFGDSPNATYGTFISKDLSIPYAYKLSNSYGLVYYPDVPRGNYTVDVYYQNQLVASGVHIDTFKNINVVYTSVPHFPIFVILFASTSALIAAIGVIIIKRAKF